MRALPLIDSSLVHLAGRRSIPCFKSLNTASTMTLLPTVIEKLSFIQFRHPCVDSLPFPGQMLTAWPNQTSRIAARLISIMPMLNTAFQFVWFLVVENKERPHIIPCQRLRINWRRWVGMSPKAIMGHLLNTSAIEKQNLTIRAFNSECQLQNNYLWKVQRGHLGSLDTFKGCNFHLPHSLISIKKRDKGRSMLTSRLQ